MPCGTVSGVGRGISVLDGWRSSMGRGSFDGKCGASLCNKWGLCGVVILYREGWRPCSSQITFGFLVDIIKETHFS